MKFSVLCPGARGDGQKSFKYDLAKGTTLEQNTANIHRSLATLGLELVYSAEDYSLDVADRNGMPVTVDGREFSFTPGLIDAELLALMEHCKRMRMRDLALLLVPRPEVRAQIVLDDLEAERTVKEHAYSLRSSLKNVVFRQHFVENDGLVKLLKVTASAKGNTLAYALAAVHEVVSSTPEALEALIKSSGREHVLMLYALLGSNLKALSACRYVADLLRLTLQVEPEGLQLVTEAATTGDQEPFSHILAVLSSEDLHSRLSAVELMNAIIKRTPPASRPELIATLQAQDVAVKLEHKAIVQQIAEFEETTGITLDRTNTLLSTEGTKEELKEKIRELGRQFELMRNANTSTEDSCDTLSRTDSPLQSARLAKDLDVSVEVEAETRATDQAAETAVEERDSEANDVEVYKKQLEEAHATIQEQEEKIRSLKHTTSLLMSEAELGAGDRVKIAGAVAAAETKKESEMTEGDNERELNAKEEAEVQVANRKLTEETEVLRREHNDAQILSYQAKIEVEKVQQEVEKLKAQKQKIQQVVTSLDQKTAALRDRLATSEAELAQHQEQLVGLKASIKEEEERLRDVQKEQKAKHEELNQGNDQPYEVLQAKLKTMEQLVMVTSREKRDFQKQISDLKTQLASLQS